MPKRDYRLPLGDRGFEEDTFQRLKYKERPKLTDIEWEAKNRAIRFRSDLKKCVDENSTTVLQGTIYEVWAVEDCKQVLEAIYANEHRTPPWQSFSSFRMEGIEKILDNYDDLDELQDLADFLEKAVNKGSSITDGEISILSRDPELKGGEWTERDARELYDAVRLQVGVLKESMME